MRTDHLKTLMRAVQKTVPDNNPGTGVLVNPEEVHEELDQISKQKKFIEKFKSYKRVDDLIDDYTLTAAQRLIFEMEFGRTSQDRRSAAKEILDRGLGKPVERVLNLNANVKQMSDQELDSSIESLLTELRYKGSKQSSSNLLLDEVEKTDNKLETKE